MTNEKIQANTDLMQLIKSFCANNREIVLVSLCTTDGFPISYFSTSQLSNQTDKLAAMSSTISSLSDSAANQIDQGQCNVTIIETSSGNLLFVKASYMGTACVLTVVAKDKMLLATARYKTKMLADNVSNLSK